MAIEITAAERQHTAITPEHGTSADTVLPPSQSTPDRKHLILDIIRGYGVVIGPALAFDIFTFGSLPALFSKRLRPVAVLGTSMLAAYWLAIRPWHLRWGATDAELTESLPGDEFEPIQASR